MNKIGILSFQHGYNYGASLQIQGTYSFLKKLGYNPEVINYINFGHHLGHLKAKLVKKNPYNIYRNLHSIRKFNKFQRNWNKSKMIFNINKLNTTDYRAIILGSDEIWNYSHPLLGRDLTYFGKDIRCPLIAFSPSCGNSSRKIACRELKNCLNSIKEISVRDQNSQKIVEFYTNKEPLITVDPIFLTDLNLKGGICEHNNFILYYGSTPNKLMIKKILTFSHKMNKKIISLGYKNNWADFNILDLPVESWVEYFKNADFIFTTSFHGAMFSIKYEKNFYVLSTAYKFNKISYWLSYLNLMSRYCDQSKKSCFLFSRNNINYKKIRPLLNKRVCQSRRYISNSLKKYATN